MSIFHSKELAQQEEALNAYGNSLRNIEQNQNEAEEGVDSFNAKLRTITNPIGGALITQPLSKFVKAGVNRALGFTEQKIREKLSDVLAKASNGDLSAFGSNLPSNVQRSIRDVLSDEVSPEVNNAFGSLSKKAQDAINLARRKAGKSIIRAGSRPAPRASTDPPSRVQMDNPEEGTPEATGVRELPEEAQVREAQLPADPEIPPASEQPADPAVEPEIDLDEVSSRVNDLGDQLDDLRTEYNQNNGIIRGQRDFVDGFRDENGELPMGNVAVDTALDDLDTLQSRQAQIQEAVSELEPEYHSGLLQMASSDARDAQQAQIQAQQGTTSQADEQGETPGATDQPAPPPDGDSSGAGQDNLDSTDVPASDAPEIGDDVITGLEDTADTLDAVAAGTSEIPVFGEIIAGIAGIASIIAGAEGAKKPAPYSGQPLSSGIQFGIS